MKQQAVTMILSTRTKCRELTFSFALWETLFTSEVCQELTGLAGLLWHSGWLYQEVWERDFGQLCSRVDVFLFWVQYTKIILCIFLKYSGKLWLCASSWLTRQSSPYCSSSPWQSIGEETQMSWKLSSETWSVDLCFFTLGPIFCLFCLCK